MNAKADLARPENRGERVATGLGDPLIALVENSSALGLLIAEGSHEDSYSGRLYLDGVTWARGDDSLLALRDFDCVSLCQTHGGAWIAQDVATDRLFPQPSQVPYEVLFISGQDYEYLMGLKAEREWEAVFKFARDHFSKLPGFGLTKEGCFGLRSERLRSPANYAALGKSLGDNPNIFVS